LSKLTQEDIRRIYHLIGVFDEMLDRLLVHTGKVGLTVQTLKDAAQDAMVHHAAFIDKFIEQREVDPYKIVSWYGFFLSRKADDPAKRILLVAIVHLNDLLGKEHLGLQLSKPHILHLYAMAKLDGSDDEFGIGKNGVYSVFSSCIDLVSEYGTGSLIVRSV
jgi:hypothetical protein